MAADPANEAKTWREDLGVADRLETRLGTMEFVDGAPTAETVTNTYNQLDLVHAVNAFMNGYQLASTYALRQGFFDKSWRVGEIQRAEA